MILIFAGAGASAAVNKERYPTTAGFFERLPQVVTGDRLFKGIVEAIDATSSSRTQDIEQVLWALGELTDWVRVGSEPSSVVGWCLAHNRLARMVGRNEEVRPIVGVSRAVVNEATKLAGAINEQVYELYSPQPSAEELANNWKPLLDFARQLDSEVEVVTTNYDLVIETAIRLFNYPIRDGRTNELIPRLDISSWSAAGAERRGGLLTKLHGSVDWSWQHDSILVGHPGFKGQHDRHVILYPGFKGQPRTPFDRLHEYFAGLLSRADGVLFVGYAFRDPHLNDVLARNLTTRARVAVINPQATKPAALGDRDVLLVSQAFALPAIDEWFKWMSQRQRGLGQSAFTSEFGQHES